MSCLLQDQFHLFKVAQFTNWGLQRSLTSRPSLCTSISSSAKAYFPQSDCCFEHKDLLLYFFYVSHTHSHSTRHKVCSQKYMEIHRAEELPAVVCVVRIHFSSFLFPLQFSPLHCPDFPLEKQFTCLITVKKTFLDSQSKGLVTVPATESHRHHLRG